MRYTVKVHARDEEKARGMSLAAKFEITEAENIAEAIVRTKATLEGLTSDQLNDIKKVQIEVADAREAKIRFRFPSDSEDDESKKGQASKGSRKSGK